jgi:triacylglycerol lipase
MGGGEAEPAAQDYAKTARQLVRGFCMSNRRDAHASEVRRPSMLDALGEFRVPLEATILWLHALTYPWPHADVGRGKTVMLIPGFMAGDITLAPMANFLRVLGHKPAASGIWSNSDCPRKMLELLTARIERVAERHGSPMVLLGHSLGGVYAREMARRFPGYVERVITMGSPIKRPRHAANIAVQAVAHSVARMRGKGDGCLSESCDTCGLEMSPEPPPDVPTTVIYSRTDGIVHWESCYDYSGSALVENVEVMCSHVGMAINAQVYKVIAERMLLATPTRFAQESASANP